MDTIKTYLENMFSGIKMTAETIRIKNDLLISMEDKYNELKAQGKSENESIGVVISEFGNIEELKKELNIETENKADDGLRCVELSEVKEFLAQKRKCALATAVSIAVIITGVAIFVFFVMFIGIIRGETDATPAGILLGIIIMIIFVAVSVGVLVMSDAKLTKFEYFKQKFKLPEHARQYAENERGLFLNKYTLYNTVGIILCILSVLFVLVPALMESERGLALGVPMLLIVVAVAVIPLIYGGTIYEGFNMVLELEEFAVKNDKADKVIGSIAGIYWPLVTAGYLLYSFLTGNWSMSWVVWPIAGLLFGGVSALLKQLSNNK